MCFHEFPQFLCVISFHLQVFRFEMHVLLYERQQPLFSFTRFFCFKSNGIFCAQTIYCRFVAVSNAICNQCVVCAVCVLFLFVVLGNVSRLLWQLSRSLRGSRSASKQKVSDRGETHVRNHCRRVCMWMDVCIVQHHISMSSQWIEIVSLFVRGIKTFFTFFF